MTDARSWPNGHRAALSLSFDDARESQIDHGLALLGQLDVRASFYVLPHRLENGRASWLAASSDGHEIGNHSMRHPCTGNFEWSRSFNLEHASLESVRADIEEATAFLAEFFEVRPLTFAYPCGQTFVGRGRNATSYVPLIAELFLAGRGYNDEFANDPAFVDLSYVGAYPLSGPFVWIRDAIDRAAREGHWLVLAGHDVGVEDPQTVSRGTISAVVDQARRQGMWIDTIANVARWIDSHRLDLSVIS